MAALRAASMTPPSLPVVVTLTRVGPGRIDSDGSVASLKSVRDQVARYLGVDDADSPSLRWEYRKQRGDFCVLVSIERQPG
jgi:hypothetical protein